MRDKVYYKEVVKFFSQGRLIEEAADYLRIKADQGLVLQVMKELVPNGRVFTQRGPRNELLYFLFLDESMHLSLKPKERIWSYRVHLNSRIPYIWIQLPDDLSWRKVKAVPLYDTHLGARSHDKKAFAESISYIKRQDNVFTFLGGDNIEFALVDSPGGAIFEQEERPQDQIKNFIKKLEPIAHKIWWALPGGHEWRSKRRVDIDPMWIICEFLDIPYFDQPIYADVLWNNKVFSFYCQHGTTHARTQGGRLNAAAYPIMSTEFTMFYVMGHVHDQMENPIVRICREIVYDEEGNITGIKLKEKEQIVMIAPAFYQYFGTYAARAGYPPPAKGVIGCVLHANGSYGALT